MASLNNEAAASSSSSSLPRSSTDHQIHYTYEVFLSFRGEDTRFNFTDHLYTALCQRGIETFIDDELKRGEEISSSLVKAIEESRVSIIIFSQNYASSRWCLDELVKILECRKSKGQEVRAVFYKVDPSDVRHQRRAFGDAFATLDQCKYKHSMDKWKAALKEAADLSGWPFKDGQYESKFINEIVGELSARVINPSCELQVAANPIGIESCREDVNRLLHTEENIVRMVGIWGPGGIGKTTIAKAVFNSIRCKFACSCFLADVRSNALIQLQKTLLFDILGDPNLKVNNVDIGVGLIKTRMRNKKVLLILDDVSHSSQLQNLVPSPFCFGPGSRILITTRDKRWLIAHQVDEVYEVKMLNDRQALKLFSLNAFKRNGPPGDYLSLAQRAVRYAQGLPLGLIVLGSHLFRRSREEWEATLDSCKEDPHIEIRDVLKISYDALGVDLKGYFLDIACFFKGESVDRVKPILEACYDLKPVTGIAQLQEKALIKINRDKIWMHDLIEEMGKDIVYQESPGEPGERSRVMSSKDVDHVLTNNTGTDKIIGIQTQVFWQYSKTSLNAKSFSGMKNLRYISIDGILEYECFSRDIDYLSNQLRWLNWPKCSLQSFPSDFHANKLVKLNIPRSRGITRLWEGCKNFSRLTCMNLSGCESLTELPDFSGIPNLEELNLYGCSSLVKVPDSVGFLRNLVTLNVDGCSNLIMFPRKIHWKYVETISLHSCKLEEFSEVGKEMASLRILDLSHNCIKELHPSIRNLIGLEELILRNCQNLTTLPHSIYELRNLRVLDVNDCPKLAAFPEILIKMDSLRELFLSGSVIRELGESIGNLIGLEKMELSDCQNLTTLPRSIYELRNLQFLDATNCPKLAAFPEIPIKMDFLRELYLGGSDVRELEESFGNLIGLEWLSLRDCKNLATLPCNIYGLQNLKMFELTNCSKLVRFPTNTNILNVDGCSLSLPKLEWFDIKGCKSLSDCDFLTTLDCWETLYFLDLSTNNFVSLPACIPKFVNLQGLDLRDCKRLREIPELPACIITLDISGCESLAVIEAESSLCSETPKRHCTAEKLSTEPTLMIPPKRQRTGPASLVQPKLINVWNQ
ncbi:disease resistance protein RPV1-like [Rosa sericea]